MKKSNKVLLIILLSLLVACGIAYMVLYCIYPANVQRYTWLVFDYICNKPLPVIGITSLTLAFIVYKIIRFVINHKITKISQLLSEINSLKKEVEDAKKEAEEWKKKVSEDGQHLLEYVDETNKNIKLLCNTIPNKKVKALGEKFYVSEEKAD